VHSENNFSLTTYVQNYINTMNIWINIPLYFNFKGIKLKPIITNSTTYPLNVLIKTVRESTALLLHIRQGYNSWLWDQLSWLKWWVVFLSHSKRKVGQCLTFDYNHFLPYFPDLLFTDYPIIQDLLAVPLNQQNK